MAGWNIYTAIAMPSTLIASITFGILSLLNFFYFGFTELFVPYEVLGGIPLPA